MQPNLDRPMFDPDVLAGRSAANQRLLRQGLFGAEPSEGGRASIIPGLMYAYYVNYRGYPPISFPRYYLDVFLGFGDKPADWTGPSWPDLQFGHLWFIQNLLVYCALYLAFRWLAERLHRDRDRRTPARRAPDRRAAVPGHGVLALFTLAVAAVTFLVRIRYPLDTWIPLLDFIQVEPARVATYASFFTAGTLTYRYDWLSRLPKRTGYTWLALGAGLALLLFGTGTDTGYFAGGGATLPSLCRSVVETFLCTGLCVGLLTLFREKLTGSTRLTRSMSASSFTEPFHPAG